MLGLRIFLELLFLLQILDYEVIGQILVVFFLNFPAYFKTNVGELALASWIVLENIEDDSRDKYLFHKYDEARPKEL